MKTPSSEIPLIDFAPLTSANEGVRLCTRGTLRAALENYGFIYLSAQPRRGAVAGRRCVRAVAAVFWLPPEIKNRAKPNEKGSTRGYEGVGVQALEVRRPGDLKEIFQCGSEPARTRPNAWPESLPEFRQTLLAFLDAAKASCDQLMRAIALSLGLPEDYFVPYHDRTDSTLRLLHYPPLTGAPAPGQLRAGAHTDFGGMNLLFQDDEGGLEIQSPDGRWIAAPRGQSRRFGGQRRSLLLRSLNPDAIISCLEPCQGPDNPPKYAPISAADHLRARAEASRRHGY